MSAKGKAAKEKKHKTEPAVEKEKMRTSEDVFNRVRWDGEWADRELVLGYEDRIEGPMEMALTAWVPMSEGGSIPFHKVWYVRDGDDVLWDRRRRLDRIFNSGETEAILSVKPPKGFDRVADENAAEETAAAVKQAKATMQRLEDERAEAVERKQREKTRRSALKGKAKAQAAVGDLCKLVEIQAVGVGAPQSSSPGLRVVTWNVLFDEHIDDPTLLSQMRAPRIFEELCTADPDIVALQEVTPAVLEVILAQWPQPFWLVKLESDLAIVSRHIITHAKSVALGPTKRALIAELAVQGRRLAMANVHFTSDRRGDDHVDNRERRAGQAKTVRAVLATVARSEDIVICGDFNEPNANGEEVAVACMDGLTDVWLKVHGDHDAGYTFDPTQNRLADLQSLVKQPRRLDRIFAGGLWRPRQASLLGLDGNASDHYGVVADLIPESPLLSAPTNSSAVVVLPPVSLWPQIDAIRQKIDPSFGRWMPHVNIIYGFLAEEYFQVAATAAEKVMRRHEPFEVCLSDLVVFEHGKSASLVAVPSSGADILRSLRADLVAQFPSCTEQTRHEFNPHLTLGKFDSVEDAHRCRVEVQAGWAPLSFVVDQLAFISRAEDKPFMVAMQLPAGSYLRDEDALLLQVLETRTGTRAFPVGSAAMLGSGRPAESDFDILLVGIEDRETVFQALEAMDVTWSRRANAKFPILQLQVGDTQLDIQYARSSSASHPVHWSSSICDEGGCAAAALRDACAVRSAILTKGGLKGWQQYQQALIILKDWAKKRCINSNALGYLGSFSWALLLANTLLARADLAEDASALVVAMWRRFVGWEWLTCGVGLDISQTKKPSDALMFIPCPSEPDANTARNITSTILAILRSEIQLAASGFGLDAKPVIREVIDVCSVFVCCEVSAKGVAQALCAAWLEARLLLLVRSLDDVGGRPLKLSPSCWLVGVPGELPSAGGAQLLVRSTSQYNNTTSDHSAAVPRMVAEACDAFQNVISRGEWAGSIEVSALDAAAVQGKIP